MAVKIDITNATRQQIISALRGYVSATLFPEILDQSTPALKALLVFYQEGGDDKEIFPKLRIQKPARRVPILMIDRFQAGHFAVEVHQLF